MNRKWRLAALLLILPAAAVSAKSKSEWLASPDLPGFVVGHSESSSIRTNQVEIPADETVQDWTRMVTTQWFKGLARRLTPTEYANSIVESLPRTCPDATVSPVETLIVAGQKAARFKVVCPKATGGESESFFMLAIAGKKDMYVKQVAFRGAASAEDFLWGRKLLEGVVLCEKKSKIPACK